MAIREVVYIGRDNAIALAFANEAGMPLDLGAAYSFDVELLGSPLANATYLPTTGGVVDASAGGGELRLRLGMVVGLPKGDWKLRLAFKASAGDTHLTQIAHEFGPDVVRVKVVDA